VATPAAPAARYWTRDLREAEFVVSGRKHTPVPTRRTTALAEILLIVYGYGCTPRSIANRNA
jgi:hypothetical protein